MKRIIALTFLSFSLGLNSCKLFINPNVPNDIEPYYCKINGKVFRPAPSGGALGGVGANTYEKEFNIKKDKLFIRASNSSDYIFININLDEVSTVSKGTYQFTNDEEKAYATYTYNDNDDPKYRDTMISKSGSITITKITTNPLRISGTFEFKTTSKLLNKDFIISNGQFNDI